MKFKKLIFSGIAAILSLSTLSAVAGKLTITNNSNIDKIGVKCGPLPGVPISKGQSIPLEWKTIYFILGRNYTGSCTFFNGSKVEGNATLVIKPDLNGATITALNITDPKLVINKSVAIGSPASDINITVTGG